METLRLPRIVGRNEKIWAIYIEKDSQEGSSLTIVFGFKVFITVSVENDLTPNACRNKKQRMQYLTIIVRGLVRLVKND